MQAVAVAVQTMAQLFAESVVQAAVEMVASVAVLHQLQVQQIQAAVEEEDPTGHKMVAGIPVLVQVVRVSSSYGI